MGHHPSLHQDLISLSDSGEEQLMVGHFSYGSVEKLWKCLVSVALILRVSFQKQKAYSFFMILCNPNFTHCSSLKIL